MTGMDWLAIFIGIGLVITWWRRGQDVDYIEDLRDDRDDERERADAQTQYSHQLEKGLRKSNRRRRAMLARFQAADADARAARDHLTNVLTAAEKEQRVEKALCDAMARGWEFIASRRGYR